MRLNNHLTQEKFSEKIYCSVQALSKWERNVNTPSIDVFKTISDRFDVSMEYLLKKNNNLDNKSMIFNICTDYLQDNIIPCIGDIESNITFDKLILKKYFTNNEELIIFIISNFDSSINKYLIKKINSYNNILNDFFDYCLPIIMEHRSFLRPLYCDKNVKGIVEQYLKDTYSNMLENSLGKCNRLKINIILSNIIEIINASMTYYYDYSMYKIKQNFVCIINEYEDLI